MDKIAAILKVTPEVIENMEEAPISVIFENNKFESGSNNNAIGCNNGEINDNRQIHPVEQILELTKQKVALLEKLVNEKK